LRSNVSFPGKRKKRKRGPCSFRTVPMGNLAFAEGRVKKGRKGEIRLEKIRSVGEGK